MKQLIGKEQVYEWMRKNFHPDVTYHMSPRTLKILQYDMSTEAIKTDFDINARLMNGDHRILLMKHDEKLIEEVTVVLSYINQQQAMRFNEGKRQWSLVDFECLEDMVRVLEFGAKKYDRDNWKKGLPMRAQCESMARHLFALMGGEINDPETGLPHWAHIQCNAMFMAHTFKHHQRFVDLNGMKTVELKNYDPNEPIDLNQHENAK